MEENVLDMSEHKAVETYCRDDPPPKGQDYLNRSLFQSIQLQTVSDGKSLLINIWRKELQEDPGIQEHRFKTVFHSEYI